MMTTLHIALNNCPGYIILEAEAILSSLEQSATFCDALRLKLCRSNMFYLAEIRIDFSGRHLSAISKSRYMNDALEDSFTKICDLFFSFNGLQGDKDTKKVLMHENGGEGK